MDAARVLSPGQSHVLLATLSLVHLPMPSPALSVGLSATPSPVDLDQECNEEVDLENNDQPEDDNVEDDKENDEVEGNDEDDEVGGDQEDKIRDAQEVQDKVVPSEDKEDKIDNFMVVSGRDPIVKEGVCGWLELRDQIKMDLVVAHKDQKSLTTLNKLLVLRNFAML